MEVRFVEDKKDFENLLKRKPDKIENYYLERHRLIYAEGVPGINTGVYFIDDRPSYLERVLLSLIEGIPENIEEEFYQELVNKNYRGALELIENGPDEIPESTEDEPKNMTRRDFLRYIGFGVAGLIVGGTLGVVGANRIYTPKLKMLSKQNQSLEAQLAEAQKKYDALLESTEKAKLVAAYYGEMKSLPKTLEIPGEKEFTEKMYKAIGEEDDVNASSLAPADPTEIPFHKFVFNVEEEMYSIINFTVYYVGHGDYLPGEPGPGIVELYIWNGTEWEFVGNHTSAENQVISKTFVFNHNYIKYLQNGKIYLLASPGVADSKLYTDYVSIHYQ